MLGGFGRVGGMLFGCLMRGVSLSGLGGVGGCDKTKVVRFEMKSE